MKIFVTGCAGFIGYHLCDKLLKDNHFVYAIDNINNYYDVSLKKQRLKNLKKNKKFIFYKYDLSNFKKINNIVSENKIKKIIHLAAQAGVRYSFTDPKTYFNSNLLGFFNILEISRKNYIKHLIFASTSSVYGDNNKFPLKEITSTENPLSFYAATKKSNEIMAYSYSNMFNLPCTALRFFTVYGPYGRPDMALFKFTKAIINNNPIELFNNGNHERDFTYINDAVSAVIKLINKPPTNKIPFNCFNIGSSHKRKLKYFLKVIEQILKKKTNVKLLPLQKGDVKITQADISKLKKFINYKPKVNFKFGIKKFIDWYKKYNKL